MPNGSPPVDLAGLFANHRDKLQGVAAFRLGGANDDADEVVQQTFVFAVTNPELVPVDFTEQQHWLVRVLEYRVRQLLERQSKHAYLGTLKQSPFVPTHDRRETGTFSHYVAASVADRSAEQPSSFDEVLADLSREDRDLLFDDPADERGRCHRTELTDRLRLRFEQSSMPGTVAPSANMRILSFIEYYSSRRQTISRPDYISQFRVLERRYGKSLRLSNLDTAFYERHVSPLSRSGRKRVLAVWNAAAMMGLIEPPACRKAETCRDPVYWSEDETVRVLGIAEGLGGEICGTNIPKVVYWPAVISLVADTGWHRSTLLRMPWPNLWANEHLKANARSRTVEYLHRLEAFGQKAVFPWLARREGFYKFYASVLRRAGMVSSLTALESSVLRGIRAGLVETELAKQHDCDVGVIRQYRRRIREKLGLPSYAPSQTIVGTAVQRGLFS